MKSYYREWSVTCDKCERNSSDCENVFCGDVEINLCAYSNISWSDLKREAKQIGWRITKEEHICPACLYEEKVKEQLRVASNSS